MFQVLSQDHITEESLEFFTILEPKLDVVVVGVGEREHVDAVRRRIFALFYRSRIGLEVLPTVSLRGRSQIENNNSLRSKGQ